MGLRNLFSRIFGSTFQLNDDDVVVFLVGPSGSGKSAFVNDVTKSGVVVGGTTLQPTTTAPQAIRCELTEAAKSQLKVSSQKNIVFVDTPSFHTGGTDLHDGADREMAKWLKKALKSRSTRIGTIYMHRIETDPAIEPFQRHLSTFASTLPQGDVSCALPERLRAVFSYEGGTIAKDKIDRHRAAFAKQLAAPPNLIHGKAVKWNTSLNPNDFLLRPVGVSEETWKVDSETAWEAVVALFQSTTR